MTCTFEGVPRAWWARVLLRLFSASGNDASRGAMRADLRDIARAVGGAA